MPPWQNERPSGWKVSVQGSGRHIFCEHCEQRIAVGDLRLQPAYNSRARLRHVNSLCRRPECSWEEVRGVTELPADLQQQMREAFGREGGEEPGQGEQGEHNPGMEVDAGTVQGTAYFDKVPWAELTVPVSTLSEIPRPMLHSFASVKAALVTDILDATAGGDDGKMERAWKALVAFDGSILWKPELRDGGKKKARLLRQTLAERIDLARQGAWGTLHDEWLRRPSADGGDPVGAAENLETTANRIRLLIEAGELKRASARILQAEPLAHGPDVPRRVQALFPTEGHQALPAPAPEPLPELLAGALKGAVAKALAHTPRRVAACLGGSRYEHWRALLEVAGGADKVCALAILLAEGRAPHGAQRALARGRLIPLQKTGGGVRAVVVQNTLLALLQKALANLLGLTIRAHTAPFQHGVGTPGGAETVVHLTAAALQANPDWGLLSLDLSNAFNELDRHYLGRALDTTVPVWAPVVRRLLAADSEHLLVTDDGAHVPVQVRCGVPQGGALSALLFALGINAPVRALDGTLQAGGVSRQLTAYMDDVDVAARPAAFPDTVRAATPVFAEAGLRLNASKTTYWKPEGSPEPAFETPLTRARLPVARVRQPAVFRVPLDVGAPGMIEAADQVWQRLLDRRQRACDRLQQLAPAGLGRHQAFCLLRTVVPADVNFHMRTLPAEEQTLTQLDAPVAAAAAALGRSAPLDPSRLRWSRLPLREGGLGLPDAKRTAPAALLASAVDALPAVAKAVNASTLEELGARAPRLAARVDAATATLERAGLAVQDDVRLGLTQPQAHLQSRLGRALAELEKDALLGELPREDRALLRSGGGPGAGTWMLPADEDEEWMPDDEFAAAFHVRLGLPMNMPATCGACTRAGMPDAAQHNNRSVHALCCPRGPSHTRRHTRVLRAFSSVLEDALGAAPLEEQVVPEWAQDGVEARLDLSFALPGGRTRHADVTVGHPLGRGSDARAAADRDGGLAAALERKKRRRYPHPELVPLALESGGRMGPAGVALLRALHSGLPPDQRAVAMRRAYRRVAMALQRDQAQTVLRAGATW